MVVVALFSKRFAYMLTAVRWTALAILACTSGNAVAKTISIAFTGEQNTALENGVKQGLLEANLQGEFLGVTYKLVPLRPGQAVAAIVVAASDETVLTIAEMHTDTPVFNIQSRKLFAQSLSYHAKSANVKRRGGTMANEASAKRG
ncbi:MAG: hypothetical protein ACU84Q_04905 [Gammaproteobacteria bacterium]